MRITVAKSAIKEARKAPTEITASIFEKLGRYAENPQAAVDVKQLQGHKNAYRLRVGDYRALFTLDGDLMTVIAIRPRGDAYK